MREGAQRILATFCYLPVRCQLLRVRARARGGGGGPTATLPFPSQRYASRGGTRRFFAHCSTERIRPASGTRGRRWGACRRPSSGHSRMTNWLGCRGSRTKRVESLGAARLAGADAGRLQGGVAPVRAAPGAGGAARAGTAKGLAESALLGGLPPHGAAVPPP